MQTNVHIIIFAKAPLAGFAKTRLIPVLGEAETAKLAKRLFFHAIEQALNAQLGTVELCVTPSLDHACWQSLDLPASLILTEQGQGDLGQRMARASKRALQQNKTVLLMGTDCPGLNADVLKQAANSLMQHDACITPVSDGGYALLGLSRFDDQLFTDIPWSTAEVARLTLERCQALNWTLAKLATLHDIDEADDLRYLPEGISWKFHEIPNKTLDMS